MMDDIITVMAGSKWNVVCFEMFISASVVISFATGEYAIGLLALAMQAGFHTVFALIRERR